MRLLIFDTETTGLPRTKIINPDTLHLWPHVVQFSYIIYDTETNSIVEMFDYVVKVRENVVIPEDSIKIHGITNETSMRSGLPIEDILNEFFYYLQTVDKLIGHNVSFDINMVRIELLRLIYLKDKKLTSEYTKVCKYNLHYVTNFKNISCTLQDSIEVCNIQAIDKYGKSYLKFPKLVELHKYLFHTEPNNLHNSLNDIIVTLRCFIKMNYDKDILDDENDKNAKLYNEIFNTIVIDV
jgi:DNA polymerase III epsilon subunit-like protein